MARKPSAYALFVKQYLRENRGSSFADAARAWKEGSEDNMARSEQNRSYERNRLQPLNILRLSVTETAANGFTQAEHATPVSPFNRTAMRIHKIVLDLDDPEVHATDRSDLVLQVTATSQSAIQDLEGAGVLAKAFKSQEPADGSPGPINGPSGPFVWDFGERGILYVSTKIFLAIDGSNNVATHDGEAIVYYTLEQVDDVEFAGAFSALQ